MAKGLVLSLPSVSANNTILSLAKELSSNFYHLIYYNTADFLVDNRHNLKFKTYPLTFKYSYSDKIDEKTSYFEFGKILIETADHLYDFLVNEVKLEKPDFIILSHLAPWGKLLSDLFDIPAITVFSTFVLDKNIMLPYFRKLNQPPRSKNVKELQQAVNLFHRCRDIAQKYSLKKNLDLWEIYTNLTDLNLAFVLKEFQPARSLLKANVAFVGYPKKAYNKKNKIKDIVYIAMGTILHKETNFFKILIDTVAFLNLNSVIVVGRSYSLESFQKCPSNIKIVPYADQIKLLNRSWLFITHGGMSSVHEAIFSTTPMIVLPVIPEQHIIADKIVEMGIGLKLGRQNLDLQSLAQAILEIQNNKNFQRQLEKLNSIKIHSSASETAVKLIKNFLTEEAKPNN